MAQLESVERQIANLEGFEVTLLHPDGRDVRGDRRGLPSYSYEWRDQRFLEAYPGFAVTMWNADGSEAHGATKLATVRDSYVED